MLSLALIAAAHALPSDGGIQVALYGPGADFAEEVISTQEFDIAEETVGGEAACYDEVGIQNLNVHIPIDDAEIEFDDDTLMIDIFFGEIHGEDMLIFGEDGDWLDVCPSFEAEFHSFQITDARVRLALQPWINGDSVALELATDPIVSGNITTDIDWVPDTLILSFVEDRIWELLGEKVGELVPGLVTEYLDTSLYKGRFGDLDMAVELVDVRVEPESLAIGMDLSVEWLGESCLVVNAPETPEGRNPEIDFGHGEGSDIGVALTEQQLNGLLLGAYADGLLCFDFGPLSGALDAVGDAIGDPVVNPDVDVEFGGPPVLRMDENRLRLRLDNFHFALSGEVDGEPVEFISLDADVDAAVELRVDPEVSAIVLDLVYVDLQMSEFNADALLSDKDGAEERLVAFLEDWVMDVVAARVQEVPLYGNLFHASNFYIRLDAAETVNGGLLVRASLFDGDDPEVDTQAPDTQARIAATSPTELTVQWKGEDDKTDALTFSWRIDGAEWSEWIGEDWALLEAPAPGAHILEVRSRDAWHNVDASPALIAFEIKEPAEAEKGCMCSTSRAPGAALAWLMLPLLWVRRRR